MELGNVIAIEEEELRPGSGPLRCQNGARLIKQKKKKEKGKKKRLNDDSGLCCEGLECLAEELSTLVDCSVEL